jgi:hypothetical protein
VYLKAVALEADFRKMPHCIALAEKAIKQRLFDTALILRFYGVSINAANSLLAEAALLSFAQCPPICCVHCQRPRLRLFSRWTACPCRSCRKVRNGYGKSYVARHIISFGVRRYVELKMRGR